MNSDIELTLDQKENKKTLLDLVGYNCKLLVDASVLLADKLWKEKKIHDKIRLLLCFSVLWKFQKEEVFCEDASKTLIRKEDPVCKLIQTKYTGEDFSNEEWGINEIDLLNRIDLLCFMNNLSYECTCIVSVH